MLIRIERLASEDQDESHQCFFGLPQVTFIGPEEARQGFAGRERAKPLTNDAGAISLDVEARKWLTKIIKGRQRPMNLC
jgi:hypothetical protein